MHFAKCAVILGGTGLYIAALITLAVVFVTHKRCRHFLTERLEHSWLHRAPC